MQDSKETNLTSSTAQQIQPALVLLRRKEVERRTALSRSRVYALMKEGAFPKPVNLGSMSVAWVESEVTQWIADRIADSRQAA